MKRVELYTDGACLGNPGPGGWAALLRWGSHERMLSGGEACTTNNRMELTALLEGLRALKEPCEVHLFSDSQYLVKALSEWLPRWEGKGFRGVKNQDLWEAIAQELVRHRVVPHWIRGHNGHPENERVDQEARRQALRQKAEAQTPCPPEEATLFP